MEDAIEIQPVRNDPAPPCDVPARFSIVDEASASWVVRKIVEAREYKDRVERWAAAEIHRAEQEEQFLIARFGSQLEDWTRLKIATSRRKSIALPGGTVGYRQEPQHVTVVNEGRAIDWCRRCLPTAVKATETLLKSKLMEHLKATGELPPGVEIGGGGERFFVR